MRSRQQVPAQSPSMEHGDAQRLPAGDCTHASPFAHGGSHSAPATMPCKQRKPIVGAHTVSRCDDALAPTVAQHPEAQAALVSHAGAQ